MNIVEQALYDVEMEREYSKFSKEAVLKDDVSRTIKLMLEYDKFGIFRKWAVTCLVYDNLDNDRLISLVKKYFFSYEKALSYFDEMVKRYRMEVVR